MTDPTQQAPDDLDAGWDEDDKVAARVIHSQPPVAALEQLEAGWEEDAESGPVDELDDGTNPTPPADPSESSDKSEATSSTTGKPAQKLGKKDRRQLEREARVHQVQRSDENRKQRKATRRELAKERAAELLAQRSEGEQPSRERKQKVKVQREKPPQPKPTAQTTPAQSEAPTRAPIVQNPTTLNRAARRSRTGKTSPRGLANDASSSTASERRSSAGTFGLFIAVVFVLSALSYLLIR